MTSIQKHLKKTQLLLCMLLLLLGQAQSQTNAKEIKDLMSAGKSKKALDLVEKEISKTGLTDELSVLKSTALLGINAEKAFENMQFTITKFPNSAAAYNMRGLFFYGINDMANSLKDFNKAYELCTTDDSLKFEILINRSGVSHHVNKIENAIADCREALKIRPDNLDALNNLSATLFDDDQFDEAEKILLGIKEKNPKYIGAYVNLGYQNQKRERYAFAEKYLLEGLALEPNEPYVLNNLGYAQFKLGKTEEALKNINKSLKFFPTNAYAYRNLALIYLAQNQKEKACEAIQKALSFSFTDLYGDEVKDLKKQNCL